MPSHLNNKGKSAPESKFRKVISYPTTFISNHMFGEKHTHRHKMGVGGVIAVIGVYIASSAHHFTLHFVQIGVDLIGYAVHGLGVAPYIEFFMKKDNSKSIPHNIVSQFLDGVVFTRNSKINENIKNQISSQTFYSMDELIFACNELIETRKGQGIFNKYVNECKKLDIYEDYF